MVGDVRNQKDFGREWEAPEALMIYNAKSAEAMTGSNIKTELQRTCERRGWQRLFESAHIVIIGCPL